MPFVVETSVGADRTTLAAARERYREEKVEGEDEGRTVLGIHPSLAPIKAGVFPLVKKDGMPEFAEKLANDLRKRFPVFYDESAAIGRRYRRQDEVGTPFCVTVDGQTAAGRYGHRARSRHAPPGAHRRRARRRRSSRSGSSA